MTDRPRHLEPVPDDEHTGPPANPEAERACLGGMLQYPTAIEDALNSVTAPEFYWPRHELIYHAIEYLYSNGEPVNPITVTERLGKDITRAGGQAYIEQLSVDGIHAVDPAYYGQMVAEKASARRLAEIGTRITQLGYTANNGNITELWQAAQTHLETGARYLPTQPGRDIPGQTVDDFLAGDDPEYAWLIPGLLERQDRLILTAGEGMGKSTLCRQIGIQTAAGIHPFTNETVDPIRVLILDLENTKRQSRRKLRPLRLQAARMLNPSNLIIECRTGGMDLTQTEDRTWLHTLIAHHQPDLLITGPIYKMASGDTDKEKDSKPVALALDALREEFDMAVILEAHTRKSSDNGSTKHRPKEPFGWSGWMRWPEFGLHISDDGELTHWRGARDERTWPHQLTRGGTWPWTASMTIANQNWVRVRQAIRDAGRKLDTSELQDATGMSRATVYRVLADHSLELAQLYFDLQMED